MSEQVAGLPAKTGFLANLSKDLPASIVVFLVALPLSMGIALAAGAPIMAGLISAAIGGIVVGGVGGAPLQVSGPAAGLAVIVYGMIQKFGFAETCALTMVAGLIQATFGFLRTARVVLAISPAVLHGMLAGIGILITLAQLHVVLGGAPEGSALHNVIELPGQIADLHGPATILGLVAIFILVVYPLIPGTKKLHIPVPLVAVVVATLIGMAWGVDMPRVSLPGHFSEGFGWPKMPHGSLGAMVQAVVTLAIVASAESLLCAVATDKLHSGPRANLDRELIGQGAANTLAGLVGGLPITGVIVRSSANIEAGGRTRMSAIFHGLWVVLFVTQLHLVLGQIPLSVLAALLVVVGVKLVNPQHIRDLVRHGEGPVYFATLAGVVAINLLAGIGIGVAVAILRLLYRLSKSQINVEPQGERWLVKVTGSLTFLTVPKLTEALGRVPGGVMVDVDLDVSLIDHAALEALHSWRAAHERTGGRVDIDQVHEWGRPTPQAKAAPQA